MSGKSASARIRNNAPVKYMELHELNLLPLWHPLGHYDALRPASRPYPCNSRGAVDWVPSGENVSTVNPTLSAIDRKKRKVWGIRYEACSPQGAHLPTPWVFSLRNTQTIQPTTAWTSMYQNLGSVKYRWLKFEVPDMTPIVAVWNLNT